MQKCQNVLFSNKKSIISDTLSPVKALLLTQQGLMQFQNGQHPLMCMKCVVSWAW